MLVACQLAGLSALEAYCEGVDVDARPQSAGQAGARRAGCAAAGFRPNRSLTAGPGDFGNLLRGRHKPTGGALADA
jgi:hypothetical protein